MNNLSQIIYFSVLLFLISCNNRTKDTAEEQLAKNAFTDSLVEKQILENKYAISIPPSIVLDSVKQKAAKLVLKVTMCENDGGSKFIWEKAKILSPIYNPSGYQLPDTISIAHYSWLQGLPEKRPCIVYLIPYPLGSEEPSDIDRWIFLEGDGCIGSIVYSSWNKQQKIHAAITELITFIEKHDIKTLMQYSTKKIYCPLCADSSQKDSYEPYISNHVFYEKCFNNIFDDELIQRIKWSEKDIRLENSEYGDYFILYTIYKPNESGGRHKGAELGFWLKEEDGILKLSGVTTIS